MKKTRKIRTAPPPGMVTSTLLLYGRLKMEPDGISVAGGMLPLRICRSTGTVGGMNAVPLIVKLCEAAS